MIAPSVGHLAVVKVLRLSAARSRPAGARAILAFPAIPRHRGGADSERPVCRVSSSRAVSLPTFHVPAAQSAMASLPSSRAWRGPKHTLADPRASVRGSIASWGCAIAALASSPPLPWRCPNCTACATSRQRKRRVDFSVQEDTRVVTAWKPCILLRAASCIFLSYSAAGQLSGRGHVAPAGLCAMSRMPSAAVDARRFRLQPIGGLASLAVWHLSPEPSPVAHREWVGQLHLCRFHRDVRRDLSPTSRSRAAIHSSPPAPDLPA